MAVERVKRNGSVTVLYSPGFGAGWSTWADDDEKEAMLFHPRLIAWVEGGKREPIDDVLREVLPGGDIPYSGGAGDLEIEWLPEGEAFEIDEYDGSESVTCRGRVDWWIA